MKAKADHDLQIEILNIDKAAKLSLKEMHNELKAERLDLEKAKAASMRFFEIYQKLPVDTPFQSSTQVLDPIEAQRHLECVIKRAGPSSSTVPGKSVDRQSFYYPGPATSCANSSPTNANDYVAYAAKKKNEEFLRRNEDSHNKYGTPIAVWCSIQRDADGLLTNKPDLSTIHREPMILFNTQYPPAWVDMQAQGRIRISQGLHNGYSVLARTHESLPDNVRAFYSDQNSDQSSPFRRRKTGQKHRKKRLRDHARHLTPSQFDEDIFGPVPLYSQSARTHANGAPMSPSEGSSSSLMLARHLMQLWFLSGAAVSGIDMVRLGFLNQ